MRLLAERRLAVQLRKRACSRAHPRSVVPLSLQVVGDYVAGFFGSEVCLYGNNCGMNCVHDTYDPEDPLDYACWVHDRCLADDVEDDCACDDALIAAANEVRASL